MDSQVSFIDALLGTRASDTERIRALRDTMAEARQTAQAAEEDYGFAQEAFARKLELLAWAIVNCFTIRGNNGRWRVGGFPELPWDTTVAEALLRAWRTERAHKPEATIMGIACLDCPHRCR